MLLKDFFNYYPPLSVSGDENIEINNIVSHSGKAGIGSMFFAIKGEKDDGEKYIAEAVKNGACCIVSKKAVSVYGPTVVIVQDILSALSKWSSALYCFPSKNLELNAVTGTNGKSTVAYLMYQILSKESPSAMIGTLGCLFENKRETIGMTTPLAHDLNSMLSRLQKRGIKTVSMEVSSHALSLHRVDDLKFDGAVFTNLTQDHMDFHNDFEDYYQAKKKLFSLLDAEKTPIAVINNDDKYGSRLAAELEVHHVTYGIINKSDYMAKNIVSGLDGSFFTVNSPYGSYDFNVNLVGEFNIYNCLAVISWAMERGIPASELIEDFPELLPAPGRLEIIKGIESKKTVVVDYAHTPAALENVLLTLKKLVKGRVLCVFGCGGDRDRSKRPMMGNIAAAFADEVYITSDNPRTEDPFAILLDIELGLRDKNCRYYVISDRREAIFSAIDSAREGDCILIAGKGDEDYQIIGTEKLDFSDREYAKEYLK